MTRVERIVLCEVTLLASAKAAKSKGIQIICNAYQSERGCCAMATLDIVPRSISDRMPMLDSGTETAREYEGIETGFDGIPYRKARTQEGAPVSRDFWRLGRRLRLRLRPVDNSIGKRVP